MNFTIRRIFNQHKVETGAVLSATVGQAVNVRQKLFIENQLITYAFDHLYPDTTLNIFRDVNQDTPSITVIKNLNDLPTNQVTI